MALPKIYTDETAARKHLEKLLWPNGPVCPHCGVENEATLLKGKSTRPGVYKCRACEKPFSVTVGTVFERSKIALNLWVYATDLMTSCKNGCSAHEIHRRIGVTYKTAWFMCHRIRKAFEEASPAPMGGEGGQCRPMKPITATRPSVPKHVALAASRARKRYSRWSIL